MPQSPGPLVPRLVRRHRELAACHPSYRLALPLSQNDWVDAATITNVRDSFSALVGHPVMNVRPLVPAQAFIASKSASRESYSPSLGKQ
jgi:hypothetical protein